MSQSYSVTEILRNDQSFLSGQLVDLNLQILGEQFAHEYRLSKKIGRHHPAAQVWRQVPGSFDDPLSIVDGHDDVRSAWSTGRDRFFDVHQAVNFVFAFTDDEKRGNP